MRGAAMAIPSAPLLADQYQRGLLTGRNGIADAGECVETAPQGNEPARFTSFRSWFSQIGREKIKRLAKNIIGFDADLIEMRLPLTTKVRIQRRRNYERLLAEKKNWFAEHLGRRGFVQWWD